MANRRRSRADAPAASVRAHYDMAAERYHEQYDVAKLYDTSTEYPANYFRLQILLKSFARKKMKRVIEVGVGEATPLIALGKSGLDIWGFDVSKGMIRQAKQNMRRHGFDPDRVFRADIQDPATYARALGTRQFDGLMAMGVMPHVADDDVVLRNIRRLIRPDGSVFIEFRNKLFSLFTFNRYTAEFIVNDLLADVSADVRRVVEDELNGRVRMNVPPPRLESGAAPGYDAIPSKFHNPFEVMELFKRHRFTNVVLRWYHYHPAMPYLESAMADQFRQEAIKLEGQPSGWRGMFLCSAFVVEARKAS